MAYYAHSLSSFPHREYTHQQWCAAFRAVFLVLAGRHNDTDNSKGTGDAGCSTGKSQTLNLFKAIYGQDQRMADMAWDQQSGFLSALGDLVEEFRRHGGVVVARLSLDKPVTGMLRALFPGLKT